MKKIFSVLAATVFLLSACDLTSSYGKKVEINKELEIYVKGDNVTESDAKKMGSYLADLWKDAHNMKSLQLSKDGDAYVVKMVVDEGKIKNNPDLDFGMQSVKTLLEQDVFKDHKVKFVITDDRFNDIKSY